MINYHSMLNRHLSKCNYEDVQEFFEEQIAVRQYEGNNPQDTAEALAFQDTIAHFSLANHILTTTTI
jgi:hypothetical protein